MARDRPSPADRGFRMPPEWAPHEATWLAWPRDPRTWVAGLEPAKAAYLDMVEALAPGERVELIVPDDATAKRVRRRLTGRGLEATWWGPGDDPSAAEVGLVRLHVMDYVDSWLRDTGPTVLVDEAGHRLAVDWRFDAWGGKYEALERDDDLAGRIAERAGLDRVRVDTVLEGGAIDVDGEGTVLTTEPCLLDPKRGPGRTRARMERLLERMLGVQTIVWLPRGITGDDTDGHVDTVARFARPGTVLAPRPPGPGDPDREPLAANLDHLRSARGADGKPLDVVELPTPEPVTREGQRLPASYANFYVGNEAVLLPRYGCEQDDEAGQVLDEAFPERRIFGIDARALVVGFGACHCLTQQIPTATPAGR